MKYVRKIVDDYCVLDLETTGFSPLYDEVIEVGILRIRNNEIVDEYNTFTKPNFGIDEYITKLTGITNEMVNNMPTFKSLKNEIIDFIGDDIILGHNTSFDIAFIQKKFEQEYNNEYIDTLQLSRKVYPNFENHKLTHLAEKLGFPRDSHRSIEDCITTKKLYDTIKAKLNNENISLESLFYSKHSINVKDIESNIDVIDENNFFYNKHCVFTGTLEKMTRKEAMQLVVNNGGILDNSVTKTTNYLILGNNDYCKSIKNGKSTKHKKAEQLKLKGQDIEIIDEMTFYDLIFMQNF